MGIRAIALAAIGVAASYSSGQYTVVRLHPSPTQQQTYGLGITVGTQAGQYNFFNATGDFLHHACLWNGDAASFLDINPSGFERTIVQAADGGFQVGFGQHLAAVQFHALLWNGTAASAIDLHPEGFTSTQALGVSGTQQVGIGFSPLLGPGPRAILWNGTASYEDLTPAGAITAALLGVSGGTQVGWSFVAGGSHATVWTGTAASAIDVHPAGYVNSQIKATDGVEHGGLATPVGGGAHAGLWTVNGFVDLHPAVGFDQTFVNGVNGGKQVGVGSDLNGEGHALLWSGTAASMIDLGAFLPAGLVRPTANAIDSQGNIIGHAVSPFAPGGIEAIMWVPVPSLVFIGFLNPVNDPADPESIFNQGRTVPFKFKLRDANGENVANAICTIYVELIGTINSPVNEGDFSTPADNGVIFRYDSDNEQYIYNLGTRQLHAGARYRVTANLPGGQSHSVTIGLR